MCPELTPSKLLQYETYRNIQFKKRLDKANGLLVHINDSSLRKEDKEALKQRIIELFQTN